MALMRKACEKFEITLFAYCLMPNHFHLAMMAEDGGQISKWMHWLMTTHVRRYREYYRGSSGHVWQGRFKDFEIGSNEHLLTVLRYIERNPARAGLVDRSEDWRWSSLSATPEWGTRPPVDRSLLASVPDWNSWVNEPLGEKDLSELRRSINKGQRFGDRPASRRPPKAA